MRISRSLNLLIPIESDKGTIWIHSTPITREVFEQFFFVMAKAYSTMVTEMRGFVGGPRVAYLMLKEYATERGQWEAVQKGLINEIIRLTNIAYPKDAGGWDMLPLHTALERKVIDEGERDDIEGELVFFTLVAHMHKPSQIPAMMEAVHGLWGSADTSLSFTDYLNSLPTSTPAANTGETLSTASVPV